MAIRKALVVGIDDYPRNPLNSCIADVKAISERIRTQYGFTDVQTLTNKDATVANVQAALRELLTGVTPEDRVLFFYSGHGHQIQVKEDLEEVLVLYDEFFRDDALSAMTKDVPPGTLTVVLDSCFSGGMDKMLVATKEGVEFALVKKWMGDEPPSALKAKALAAGRAMPFAEGLDSVAGAAKTGVTYRYRPFGAAPIQSYEKAFGLEPAGPTTKADTPSEVGQSVINAVLLTASSENETASAKTSKSKGLSAFTYGVFEVLGRLGPNVAPSTLVAEVTQELRKIGVKQTPRVRAPQAAIADTRSFLLLEATERAEAIPAVRTRMTRTEGVMARAGASTKSLTESGAQPGAPGAKPPAAKPPAAKPPAAKPPAAKPPAAEPPTMEPPTAQPPAAQPPMEPPTAQPPAMELPAMEAPAAEEQEPEQKIIGAVLGGLVSAAPAIIDAFRKGYEAEKDAEPEADPAAAQQKWLPVAIAALSAVPSIVRAFRKEYSPEKAGEPLTEEEEQKGWGDVVRVYGPRVLGALPGVINELRKEYEPEKADTPEGQQKLLGALVRTLGPALVRAAPAIIGELTKSMEPGFAPEVEAGESKGFVPEQPADQPAADQPAADQPAADQPAADESAAEDQEKIAFRRYVTQILREAPRVLTMLRKEFGETKGLAGSEAAEELVAEVASELAPGAQAEPEAKGEALTEEEQQKFARFLGPLAARAAVAGARWAWNKIRED